MVKNIISILCSDKVGISILLRINAIMLTLDLNWFLLMDIMWPISQLHFHISHLCSLK